MKFYRDDVDGMRAICIAAVLMFHAGFEDWRGGYIGVDVFFVISGYLITSMIAPDIAGRRFKLLNFYERRARRLLAATIPVVVFTTLFAWAFYTTDTFLAYSQSLLAFATYVSNWYFLATTGYFATSPDATPLLHTWSLAVEEQFYLFFPALLLALNRYRAAIVPVLAILAALSLGYAQTEINLGNHDRAFFSLLSRFWELMAGALLALRASDAARLARYSTPMRAAGLAMIIVPVFTFGPTTSVPGIATLIPVIGALLLLGASPSVSDPFSAVLRAGPMVYLGKISYSLYLWHWPILGAAHTLFMSKKDLPSIVAILVSVAAAALSYRYLEHPVRTRQMLPLKRHMAGLVAASLLVMVAFGASGWATGGWPGRFDPAVEAMAALAAKHPEDPDNCFKTGSEANDFCTIGAKPGQPIDLVLWGDSHAGSLLNAFRSYAKTNGLSFAATTRGDCLPLVGVWRTKDDARKDCLKFNDAALDFITANGARSVAIAARWSVYTNGPQLLLDDAHRSPSRTENDAIYAKALERTLEALSGRNVILIEQVPELHADLPSAYLLMHRISMPPSAIAASLEGHRKKLRRNTEALDRLAETHRFARFDPADILCARDPCTLEADGKLLYFDDDHLNSEGAMFLYPSLAVALDQLRAPRSAAQSARETPVQSSR